MGQGDVIEFLEKCDTPVSSKQIAEGLKENPIKIFHIISNLLKWREIEFEEYSGKEVKEIAGYSPGRRTRFYYLKTNIKIKIIKIKN